MSDAPVYLIGDLHGHFGHMKRLLREAGLMEADGLGWTGGAARLWFMGDFFDRGPDGVSCLALAMKLQEDAAREGGMVDSLIGNHEVNMLAALRFPNNPGMSLYWTRNGGNPDELEKLNPEMLEWIMSRPALALEGDVLLMHADATFYNQFGTAIETVNTGIAEVLNEKDVTGYAYLIELFGEHQAFYKSPESGRKRAEYMLETYGGSRLVHGHTPIHHMTQVYAEDVTEPLVYHDGLCTNVDGSIYSGGQGFVYRV
jgi:hypothetical protein